MTRKLLTDVGEAMYGPRWQTELSRDLGVADRTVRRWAAGTVDMPESIWPELLDLLTDRGEAIDAAIERLKLAAG